MRLFCFYRNFGPKVDILSPIPIRAIGFLWYIYWRTPLLYDIFLSWQDTWELGKAEEQKHHTEMILYLFNYFDWIELNPRIVNIWLLRLFFCSLNQKLTYHHFQKMTRGIGMDHSQYLFSFFHHWLEFWSVMYKTLELFLQEILPEVQLKPGPLHNNLHDGFGDDHIHPLVKSFIGGTVDCFDAKSTFCNSVVSKL